MLDPFGTYEIFKRLRALTDLELEFHGHDDIGLATANTLAAIKGGATHASVCVLGLGERAGNAPLEQVAVALSKTSAQRTNIDFTALPALILVQHALGDRVQANWPAILYPAAAIAATGLGRRWQRLFAPAAILGLALTAVVWIQAIAASSTTTTQTAIRVAQ